IGIIHGFESIEIEEHETNRLMHTFASSHGLHQPITKEATIHQSGQVIILCKVGQAFFSAFPLNSIADSTSQQLGMTLAFDEIILRPLLDRLKSQTLVAHAAQDDNGDRWTGIVNLSDRRET